MIKIIKDACFAKFSLHKKILWYFLINFCYKVFELNENKLTDWLNNIIQPTSKFKMQHSNWCLLIIRSQINSFV